MRRREKRAYPHALALEKLPPTRVLGGRGRTRKKNERKRREKKERMPPPIV
jgi:hypothetical protein